MTFVEPPPCKPSDDLEGLLRAFFRSQMPQTWPSPRLPRTEVVSLRPPTTNRRGLMRSRWALAASVALLLLGSLLLPRRFSQDAKPEPFINAPGTANRNILPEQSNRHQSKPNEDNHKAELPADDGDRLPEMDDADLPFIK